MSTIFALPIVILFVVVLFEIIVTIVCKPFVSEKKLDAFFAKHLARYAGYGMNKAGDMFYGPDELPYIAKFPFPLPLGRWAFGYDEGRIPRWSKWNKKLDEMRKEQHTKREGIEKYL